MAEYCVDCWNEINETNDPPKKFILSRYPELCEGCEEMKRVVITTRRFPFIPLWMHIFLLPFYLIRCCVFSIAIKLHFHNNRKRKLKKNKSQ